jgi:solute:Na+ symporter, SSS family
VGLSDIVVIVVYLGLLLFIGFRFAGRQRTTDTYFVANRRVPGWAMGLSLTATIITSITFVAYPGAAYAGNWSLMVPNLMFPAVLLLAGSILVPFFRHSVERSAYAYFGRRFGTGVQLYSALAFAVGQFAKMGFVIYLAALTLNSITGWNVVAAMAITGGIAVVCSMVGGVEAAIWADVVQGFVLWAGIFISVGCLLWLTPGGTHAAVHTALANHKIGFAAPAFSLKESSLVVLVIYGFFFYLQKYTADQTVVQRYLVARTDRAAVRGIALGAVLCVPVWASFMLIGTLLWSFYRLSHERFPPGLVRADQVFPHFLATHLPPGAAGLFIASFLGAAISMLASDINCVSLVGVDDFYRNLRPNATDRQCLYAGKLIAGSTGVAAVLIAVQLARFGGPALSFYYTVTAIAAGGLAGLFLLAFMSRRAGSASAHAGIVTSLLVTLWAALTANGGHILNLGLWNFPWHEYLIGAAGHLSLLAGALLFTFIFPARNLADPALTLYGWLARARLRLAVSAEEARTEVPDAKLRPQKAGADRRRR